MTSFFAKTDYLCPWCNAQLLIDKRFKQFNSDGHACGANAYDETVWKHEGTIGHFGACMLPYNKDETEDAAVGQGRIIEEKMRYLGGTDILATYVFFHLSFNSLRSREKDFLTKSMTVVIYKPVTP